MDRPFLPLDACPYRGLPLLRRQFSRAHNLLGVTSAHICGPCMFVDGSSWDLVHRSLIGRLRPDRLEGGLWFYV